MHGLTGRATHNPTNLKYITLSLIRLDPTYVFYIRYLQLVYRIYLLTDKNMCHTINRPKVLHNQMSITDTGGGMKKLCQVFAAIITLCFFGVGASSAQVQNKLFSGAADQTYYMCTFVSGVEYWVAAFEGFKDAAKQVGAKAVYQGTTEYDIPKQVTAF